MNKQVNTLEELLKKASSIDGLDCYIKLNSGLKSSKFITYDEEEDSITIYNMIDGTREDVNLKEFINSNIVTSLNKKCLYEYGELNNE